MTVFLNNLKPENFVEECFTVIRSQRAIFDVIITVINIIIQFSFDILITDIFNIMDMSK